jgi:thimet oligopeptidase
MQMKPVKSMRWVALAWCCAVLPLPAAAQEDKPDYPVVPLHTVASIERICPAALARHAAAVKALQAVAPARFLVEWNKLQALIQDTEGPMYFLADVHPDKAVRDAAQACEVKLANFNTAIGQNARLYAILKRVKPKDAVETQLRKDLLLDFEDTGVALPPERRARAKAIFDRLDELGNRFGQNVREDPTKVSFTPREMEGLSPSYLADKKRDEQGNYVLGLDYPSYLPFMESASNEEARRRYYTAKLNEGGTQNIALLNEVVKLRKELAGLFGYASYADFSLRRKMAASRQRVQAFLAEVKTAVTAAERRDVDALREAKAAHLGKPLADTQLHRWDSTYYTAQLKKTRFNVDQQALRAYFPTDAAVRYAIDLAETLYGIRFQARAVPLWHPDVRFYEVYDRASGARMAGIYLDLFPRDGKYNHAAEVAIVSGSTLLQRKPLTALIANFNRQGLTQEELETLLHEFGHALHDILSNTRYINQAGVAVKRDFVEAPSQMFEEWARREEPLKRFAQACPSCPALTREQLAQLDAARKFGRGLLYARQWLFASYDMALYGEQPGEAMQVWKALESDTPLGHPEGTRFPASFNHVVSGYAAGYYGYMWSEVLALDMLSAFEGGMLDARTGRRYRDHVLGRGAELPPDRLVKDFLGREPNAQAFFKEITGTR